MPAHLAAVRQLPLLAVLVPGVTMHTTGLARDLMDGLYEGDRLAAALVDARERTLAIYAHLDLPALEIPRLAIVNPPIWELAHIAWFQEYWCLRGARDMDSAPRPSMLEGADALFDSSRVPHATRGSLPYPALERLTQYGRDTLDATLEALARTPREPHYFFQLALLHEDMHGEALLMTLQTLALPPPPGLGRNPPPSPWRVPADIAIRGGEFTQGSEVASPGFAFDNERSSHRVMVESFAISREPVSQGEYMAFLEDTGALPPRHWRRTGSGWEARRFDRWMPVEPGAPMVHVSLRDAEAYCRWARRRLPTEAEWEFAARAGGEARYPWGDAPMEGDALDLRHHGPSTAHPDPAPAANGLRQMIGGVWEWTSTPFAPYPGFEAGPYRDYSQPWFHSHYVLRGGSFATRSRLAHNRFRNFYLPDRADAFAGFRTCAIE